MAMFTASQPASGWKFWLLWMGASALAVLASLFVTALLSLAFGWFVRLNDPLSVNIPQHLAIFVAATGMALIGACVGAGQWLVLRHYIARSGWWVLATLLGFGLGFSI